MASGASLFSGFIQGGTAGAAAGPWGALAGGILGLGLGALDDGDQSSGRGSTDVRDPAYHGAHWGREQAFREQHCGTYAAPTGRERDSEIPQRTRALAALLAGDPQRRIVELGRRVGLPDQCLNISNFFGTGPVPAAVPFASGWPKFSLQPSIFQQVATRAGLSPQALFDWILRGPVAAPPAAPAATPEGVTMGVGESLLTALEAGLRGAAGSFLPGYTPRSAEVIYGMPGSRYPVGQLAYPAQFDVINPPSITGLDLPMIDIVKQGSCPTTFRSTTPGIRPVKRIMQSNPNSGAIEVWQHMGHPVLFSGDLANARRVRKIAARAARVAGGKRCARRGRR